MLAWRREAGATVVTRLGRNMLNEAWNYIPFIIRIIWDRRPQKKVIWNPFESFLSHVLYYINCRLPWQSAATYLCSSVSSFPRVKKPLMITKCWWLFQRFCMIISDSGHQWASWWCHLEAGVEKSAVSISSRGTDWHSAAEKGDLLAVTFLRQFRGLLDFFLDQFRLFSGCQR